MLLFDSKTTLQKNSENEQYLYNAHIAGFRICIYFIQHDCIAESSSESLLQCYRDIILCNHLSLYLYN